MAKQNKTICLSVEAIKKLEDDFKPKGFPSASAYIQSLILNDK